MNYLKEIIKRNVSMNALKVAIKDVVVGDLIKSIDPNTNEVVYKKVTAVMYSEVPEINHVTLAFANGVVLRCSNNHPIMVHGTCGIEEVLPMDLTISHDIISSNGLTKLATLSKEVSDTTRYLDITVEDTHTFFVADTLESDMVLTHNSQGGIRGASATFNFPLWHLEFETLIELKNNKGTHETRLPVVDYCVALNKTMYERLLQKGNITFFSPDEVPDLYEAFYGPAEEFKVLYEKYEKDVKKTKKTLPAIEVFTKLVMERFGTGRIYILHADHVNTHSSFNSKVYMTNLCCEITLPTSEMGTDESLIALCTLSAINWGKVRTEVEMAEACNMAVRALDALLDYQDYPNVAAARHTALYRPLGVGIINLAYDMVKSNKSWNDEDTYPWVEEKMSLMSYYLIKASVDLAEELGPCPGDNKYKQGIFPIDTCIGNNIPIPSIGFQEVDWEGLREKAKTFGIRNSTLMAMMPSESSSQLANATNGIEPPRSLITTKGNKDSAVSQVVPDYIRLGHAYEVSWDIPVSSYLQVMARIQKYTDQAISVNENLDPNKGEITVKMLIENLLLAYKLGIKTLYYSNTNTDEKDAEDDGCESGACKI